jgi:amidase
MTALNELSATEMVAAVRAGRTTCEAITRACLERVAAREQEVRAWQYINPDQAIVEAKARDRSDRKGALIGVPFSVKDIIDTADMPTEYGSPIYTGHRPRADASCVALSRKAGGVLLGKSVTTEFANVTWRRATSPSAAGHGSVRSWSRSTSSSRPAPPARRPSDSTQPA